MCLFCSFYSSRFRLACSFLACYLVIDLVLALVLLFSLSSSVRWSTFFSACCSCDVHRGKEEPAEWYRSKEIQRRRRRRRRGFYLRTFMSDRSLKFFHRRSTEPNVRLFVFLFLLKKKFFFAFFLFIPIQLREENAAHRRFFAVHFWYSCLF